MAVAVGEKREGTNMLHLFKSARGIKLRQNALVHLQKISQIGSGLSVFYTRAKAPNLQVLPIHHFLALACEWRPLRAKRLMSGDGALFASPCRTGNTHLSTRTNSFKSGQNAPTKRNDGPNTLHIALETNPHHESGKRKSRIRMVA